MPSQSWARDRGSRLVSSRNSGSRHQQEGQSLPFSVCRARSLMLRLPRSGISLSSARRPGAREFRLDTVLLSCSGQHGFARWLQHMPCVREDGNLCLRILVKALVSIAATMNLYHEVFYLCPSDLLVTAKRCRPPFLFPTMTITSIPTARPTLYERTGRLEE